MEPKRYLPILIVFAMCMVAKSCPAQTPAVPTLEQRVAALEILVADLRRQPQDVVVAASTAEASGERPDVSVDREKIAAAIIEASRQSDMSRWKKRRVKRVMTSNRGRLKRAKEQAIDMAASEMLTAGVIVATQDGVEAAINFEVVLGFLEKLMPFILQIIGLFG